MIRSTGLNAALARVFATTAIAAIAVTTAYSVHAIEREKVLVRAKAFAFHPWRSANANSTASCNAAYTSIYAPGDYMGLPYDWGGYMTLFDFDQQIDAGYGAGSYPNDGVLACTSGVDCSGFISKTWDSGHFITANVHTGSGVVSVNQMLPGDIFNEAGYHMALFNQVLASGEPELYESVGYNVHYSLPGWSWVDGYIPRRYNNISGTTVGNPVGTSTNPIVIGSFPYSDSRNTTQSSSDVLDGCGASPSTSETGHEFIYQVTLTQPGQLSAMIQDDAGVDIDIHIYSSMNTSDCFARHDVSLNETLDCGTYYVVADTFAGAQEYPGAYSLTVDFTPGSGSCGSGPPTYDFEGELGDPCAYPGNENLPFCNPNLDATTCIYTSSASFCSKPCTSNADCTDINGGCCEDIGNNEFYCVTADLCGGTDPGMGGGPPGPGGDPNTSSTTGAMTTVGAGGSGQGVTVGNGGSDSTGSGLTEDDDGSASASSCSVSNAGPLTSQRDRGMAGLALALAGLSLVRRRRQS